MLAIISAFYFRETSPYRVEFTNVLAVIAQYQILLMFLCALMIETGSLQALGVSGFVIGVFMITTNSLVIVLALAVGYLHFAAEEAEKLRAALHIVKIEMAAHFSKEKFRTTLTAVTNTSVAKSHVLCYHYTSMVAAQKMVRTGIPVMDENEAVVFSLRGPDELHADDPALRRMSPVSECREAVGGGLACARPNLPTHPAEGGSPTPPFFTDCRFALCFSGAVLLAAPGPPVARAPQRVYAGNGGRDARDASRRRPH